MRCLHHRQILVRASDYQVALHAGLSHLRRRSFAATTSSLLTLLCVSTKRKMNDVD